MGTSYRYIHNSSTPLVPGEELYRRCELGLDEEEIQYIKENHALQIRVGGEPFYLFQRQSGSAISGTITTYSQTTPNYVGILWTPADGESKHPDIRINQNTFFLYNDGNLLTRVYDQDFILNNNEYYIERQVGTSSTNKGTLRVHFNEGFTPGTVTYQAATICSCVDLETGFPNRECSICKGTSTPVAFIQYLTSGSKYQPHNTILVRVPMGVETYGVDRIGRVKRRGYRHWILPTPYVYNYDILQGTVGRNENVLFEIIEKYDSRLRGILLHQEISTLRLEEDDIRYSLVPQVV